MEGTRLTVIALKQVHGLSARLYPFGPLPQSYLMHHHHHRDILLGVAAVIALAALILSLIVIARPHSATGNTCVSDAQCAVHSGCVNATCVVCANDADPCTNAVFNRTLRQCQQVTQTPCPPTPPGLCLDLVCNPGEVLNVSACRCQCDDTLCQALRPGDPPCTNRGCLPSLDNLTTFCYLAPPRLTDCDYSTEFFNYSACRCNCEAAKCNAIAVGCELGVCENDLCDLSPISPAFCCEADSFCDGSNPTLCGCVDRQCFCCPAPNVCGNFVFNRTSRRCEQNLTTSDCCIVDSDCPADSGCENNVCVACPPSGVTCTPNVFDRTTRQCEATPTPNCCTNNLQCGGTRTTGCVDNQCIRCLQSMDICQRNFFNSTFDQCSPSIAAHCCVTDGNCPAGQGCVDNDCFACPPTGLTCTVNTFNRTTRQCVISTLPNCCATNTDCGARQGTCDLRECLSDNTCIISSRDNFVCLDGSLPIIGPFVCLPEACPNSPKRCAQLNIFTGGNVEYCF